MFLREAKIVILVDGVPSPITTDILPMVKDFSGLQKLTEFLTDGKEKKSSPQPVVSQITPRQRNLLSKKRSYSVSREDVDIILGLIAKGYNTTYTICRRMLPRRSDGTKRILKYLRVYGTIETTRSGRHTIVKELDGSVTWDEIYQTYREYEYNKSKESPVV